MTEELQDMKQKLEESESARRQLETLLKREQEGPADWKQQLKLELRAARLVLEESKRSRQRVEAELGAAKQELEASEGRNFQLV